MDLKIGSKRIVLSGLKDSKEKSILRERGGQKMFQSHGEELYVTDKRAKMQEVLKENEQLKKQVTALKEELEEGDYWQERHKSFVENGHCPDCYRDEETLWTHGHEKGCSVGELEAKIREYHKALFCKELGCKGKGEQLVYGSLTSDARMGMVSRKAKAGEKCWHHRPCPTCSQLREKLKKEGKCWR